jgi:hypothetical protein
MILQCAGSPTNRVPACSKVICSHSIPERPGVSLMNLDNYLITNRYAGADP